MLNVMLKPRHPLLIKEDKIYIRISLLLNCTLMAPRTSRVSPKSKFLKFPQKSFELMENSLRPALGPIDKHKCVRMAFEWNTGPRRIFSAAHDRAKEDNQIKKGKKWVWELDTHAMPDPTLLVALPANLGHW